MHNLHQHLLLNFHQHRPPEYDTRTMSRKSLATSARQSSRKTRAPTREPKPQESGLEDKALLVYLPPAQPLPEDVFWEDGEEDLKELVEKRYQLQCLRETYTENPTSDAPEDPDAPQEQLWIGDLNVNLVEKAFPTAEELASYKAVREDIFKLREQLPSRGWPEVVGLYKKASGSVAGAVKLTQQKAKRAYNERKLNPKFVSFSQAVYVAAWYNLYGPLFM